MTQRKPREKKTSEVEPEATRVEDVEALKKALEEEKAKAENYLASWQRTQADFINSRRRWEQEKEEMAKFANSTLVLSLLPVLDDLERALEHVGPEMSDHEWVEGIRLIQRKLLAALEANGVRVMEAVGQPFDPNLHEAAMHGPGESGMVVGEVQKGYFLHDRVLRPARVIVGNGEAAAG